jgi:hypothetical protein
VDFVVDPVTGLHLTKVDARITATDANASEGAVSCTAQELGVLLLPEPPASDAGANGDPHFKTWRGHHYDFHGVCHLILLLNTEFESGLGVDVHIRTHMRRGMSYISSAVLRVGRDVLEVESKGVYYLNGVLCADLPVEFGGFSFKHTHAAHQQTACI